jgi:hypothetical protein
LRIVGFLIAVIIVTVSGGCGSIGFHGTDVQKE